jgi:hypothetical protein
MRTTRHRSSIRRSVVHARVEIKRYATICGVTSEPEAAPRQRSDRRGVACITSCRIKPLGIRADASEASMDEEGKFGERAA